MVSVHRFYRFAIWLPILVSGAAMLGAALVGLPTLGPLNLIVMSLILSGLYGSIPYSLLALWASRWIQGRSENEIRRLALFMPVLMLAAFLPFAFLIGASDGDPLFGGLFMMLIAVPYILVLGYAYVGLVFWLRSIAQTRKWISTAPVSAA
jgi:hypothetical protein